MAITCTGYVVNSGGTGWTEKGDGSAEVKDSHSYHAERKAWGKLPASTAYLMVQDAFPCSDCHSYFLAESQNGHSVIIKVTANHGAYSAEHGFGLKGSTPCIIYYHGGTARYDSVSHRLAGGAGGAHGTFPAHPDFTNY
jgi:hypothetical protein